MTTKQASIVKLQVVTLASKLLVLSPLDRTLQLLGRYVLNLARYDQDYDVRDRARMMASLLSGTIPDLANGTDLEERGGVVLRSEQVKMVLFDGKSNVTDTGLRHKGRFCYISSHPKLNYIGNDKSAVGSLSAVTGKPTFTDSILPDWLEHGVESSLRNSEEDIVPGPAAPSPSSAIQTVKKGGSPPVILTPSTESRPESRSGANKGQWTNLDEFYADTEEVQAPESEEDREEATDEDAESESEPESEPEKDQDGDDSNSYADSSGHPSIEHH